MHPVSYNKIRFNAFGIPYLVEFANVAFRSRSRAARASRKLDARRVSSSLHKPSFESRPSFDSKSSSFDSRPSLDSWPSLDSKPSFDSRSPLRLRPVSSRLSCESDWTFATASSETLHAHAHTGPTLLKPAPPPYASKPLPEKPKIVIESEIESEGEGLLIRFASQPAQPPRRLSESRLARFKYRIAKAVMAAGMHTSPSAQFDGPDASPAASVDDGYEHRVSICSIYSDEVEERGLPGSLFRGTYGQVMAALEAAGLTTTPCMESGVQYATRLGALFVARQNPYGGVEFTKLTLWA